MSYQYFTQVLGRVGIYRHAYAVCGTVPGTVQYTVHAEANMSRSREYRMHALATALGSEDHPASSLHIQPIPVIKYSGVLGVQVQGIRL